MIRNFASDYRVEIIGYLNEDGPSSIYNKLSIPYLGRVSEANIDTQVKYWITELNSAKRLKLTEFVSGAGGRFFSFFDSSAVIGNFVTFGEGVIIGSNTYIGDYSHVGSFSIIFNDSLIRRNVSIGLFCQIGSNSIIDKGVTIGDGNLLGKNTYLKSLEYPKYNDFEEFVLNNSDFINSKMTFNLSLN